MNSNVIDTVLIAELAFAHFRAAMARCRAAMAGDEHRARVHFREAKQAYDDAHLELDEYAESRGALRDLLASDHA